MALSIAEWAGSIGAAAGALILALRGRWSGWGFMVMLAFTGVLLAAAIARPSWPHAALFAAYEAINLLGIYRWLVAARNGA